jgi:predicted RNA-binding Zn ribbon-like protein
MVDLFYHHEFSSAPNLAQDVSAVLAQYGEPDPTVMDSDIADLAEASRQLYALFAEAALDQAAAIINAVLARVAEVPRLSSHDRTRFHMHLTADDAPWGTWLLSASAWAFAVLLAEEQRNPAGLCAARGCGRPILTVGRGQARRYCSPRCASRVRVARYRQRQVGQ